jgi:hypothetical protein
MMVGVTFCTLIRVRDGVAEHEESHVLPAAGGYLYADRGDSR